MTFEPFHPWTISTREAFLQCLEKVRETGYGTDFNEQVEGLHCVGGPILDAEVLAVASIWITGISLRMSVERIHKIAPLVVKACSGAHSAKSS